MSLLQIPFLQTMWQIDNTLADMASQNLLFCLSLRGHMFS